MADIAIGRSCPNDGTLTACSGAYSDELLIGMCAYCSQAVTVPNPARVMLEEFVAEGEAPPDSVEQAEQAEQAEAEAEAEVEPVGEHLLPTFPLPPRSDFDAA